MSACVVLAEGYSYPTLLFLIRQSLHAGSPVLLRGKPGVGKSSLAYELADEHFKLPVIDKRLAQMHPAEIGGVYVPDWVREASEQPVFLFLDEINAAVSKLHQAAAYQIILERRVGPFTFHEGTIVMPAGNLEEDEALAVPMSSALQNRFRRRGRRRGRCGFVGGDVAALVALRSGDPARRRPDKKRRSLERGSAS